MLKRLTDSYYRMSTETEALLQCAIVELQREHAPSEAMAAKINDALAELRVAYSQVRAYAAQKIAAEEMPDEAAPIQAYVAIINSKRAITEGILQSFLQTYTENVRYIEVLADAHAQARQLLRVFQADDSSEPDVQPYKAFVDGIRMGSALDSDEGDSILDMVETLNKKLARGLQGGHFKLRTETPDAKEPESADSPSSANAEPDPPTAVNEEPDPPTAMNEEPDPPIAMNAEPDPPTAMNEEPDPPTAMNEEPDPSTAVNKEPDIPAAKEGPQESQQPVAEDDPDAQKEASGEAVPPVKPVESTVLKSADAEDTYIFARSYKAGTSLPHQKKLKVAFNSNENALLLASIGTTHLISEELIDTFASSDCHSAPYLNALESKGYLVAYEMAGKVYYCPSRMFAYCMSEPTRAEILRDIRNLVLPYDLSARKKRLSAPLLIGTEKITKDTLLKDISLLNVCIAAFRMELPIHIEWDRDREVYRVSGVDAARDSIFTDVCFVAPDSYADWTAKADMSVCSYGDALPDRESMAKATAKNCFFYTDTLYHWDGAEWKVFPWQTPPDDAPPRRDENTPTDNAPEAPQAPTDASPAEPAESETLPDNPPPQTPDNAAVVPQDERAQAQVVVTEIPTPPATQELPNQDSPQTPATAAKPTDATDKPPVSEPPIEQAGSGAPAAALRASNADKEREYYLSLAYKAYAAGRRGIGSAMMRALAKTHPDVLLEWRKWACASADCAYTEARNATRLQEIYPDANASGLADSALAVAAYLRMYFSNDAAKEYWVRSVDAIASTQVLRRMNSLRELMQRLQNYVAVNQCGIHPATLMALRQESGIEDRIAQLKVKADELIQARLMETTIGNSRVKDLLERLFGNNSLMMDALQCICEDRKSEAARIREALKSIRPDLLDNSQPAMEDWIVQLWNSSDKKQKGKNATDNLQGAARNSAVRRTKDALSVINQWLTLCPNSSELSEQTRIAASAEVKELSALTASAIDEVRKYRATLNGSPMDNGALLILEDTLRLFSNLMSGKDDADTSMFANAEVAWSSAIAVEEDGMVYIIPAEEMVMPYEQCIILANLLENPPVTAADAAQHFMESSMVNVNPTGGNFSNGRYLLNCAAQMKQPSQVAAYSDEAYDRRAKTAASIVAFEERRFHAHMEMAQGYGWFNSYVEQERIEHAVAAQCEVYRIFNDFSACVECMKRTVDWCHQTARMSNHDQLIQELNDIIRTYTVSENNSTIIRIRKLIDQDCYTAATAEIRKIRKDGCVQSQSSAASKEELDSFIRNFQSYYSAVSDINTSLEAAFNKRNEHHYKGYVSSGREMLRAWPQSHGSVNSRNIKNILERLNLDVDCTPNEDKGMEGHVTVHFKPDASIKFVHPIADFGSKMIQGGLDVFFMGGNKKPDQYFDLIRTQIGRGTAHAAIFFVNSALPLSVRRQLTSKIWHELGSTKPLILFDRVLALYVAEHEKMDRWNVLLQCALPFTMVKPYTENSNAQQPREMFVGRARELGDLTSFGANCANLVYGGRQLGKSALLYRVEQEVHNEKESTYVVFCSIKDMSAADAVRHILLAMCRKNVPDAEDIPLDSSWTELCFQLQRIMTKRSEMKLMLLIDEADCLLAKDKKTSYSALSEIKRLQDAFQGRFKFVFAGLHNVMRLHKEALNNNSDLPKLGHLNIKPLDYADAETLLKKPLSYMGFMFNDSEEQQALISMILSSTNYYPGLIHYYCASQLNTLGDGYTEAAPTKPPYELDDKLLLKLLQKKEFMEQVKQKFMMTLGIDQNEHQYYSVLAYLMAYCYDENARHIDGVSVEEICCTAQKEGIAVISALDAGQVETLLDELCELNILYHARALAPKRYVFSRPTFKEMLGTQGDIMTALLNYTDIEEVSQ